MDGSVFTGLQFNVSQLLKSEVGAVRSYDFAAPGKIELDGSSAHDVTGHVKFTLTNFGILAAVEAQAVLDLNCARCVEAFHLPTRIAFEEEYQPSIDIATGLPSTVPYSDTAFTISQNHTIHLGEAIRQYLLLNVELVPLCDVACKGLCQTCGTNLNTETCGCPPLEAPSPFAALQGLLGGPETEK